MTAILWDWNGTLLDDTSAALGALNVMLARRNLPPVSWEFYRRNFAFPSRVFYRLIGLDPDRVDWDALAREYHDTYAAQPKKLAADAVEALSSVRGKGVRQFVLSALRQDLLERDIATAGIGDFFERLVGSDNLDGASKLERAKAFVAELRAEGCDDIVLVGDALHDAEVAAAAGARCILYGGGSHAPERLAAVGPVFDTLVACAQETCANKSSFQRR